MRKLFPSGNQIDRETSLREPTHQQMEDLDNPGSVTSGPTSKTYLFVIFSKSILSIETSKIFNSSKSKET